ncbi:sialate O-acetylesterase [Flavivirga sp. 57AJ16]|uniref:sialate O-acetylesterase n=1 Tax=Flavivirga sp. 57AJ16 TaxID=3025307 RepID=UPI002366F164|nr:sialate O-acetylesterase [Flavivirga sp. 57AJ16]MDD7886278.1 sialate O-acetylesterase [Flavivirga sp. 57AJ16]
MKKILAILLVTAQMSYAQISIGTINPDPSAVLEVNSTTKGFLIPRMTKSQINNISNPTEGLMVYCTDCNPKGINVYMDNTFIGVSEEPTFELSDFPVQGKIYKRDKITNIAPINIAGKIHYNYGASSVILEIYRNNVLQSTQTETLTGLDSNNKYSFSFSTTITAELASYKFVLKTNTDLVLREASDVMAGDIYIVTGQSNSIGTKNNPTSNSNSYVKTFGSPNIFTNNLNILSTKGIGDIGFHVADRIVNNEGIPVLVFNGGRSGRPIQFFQRNDADKYDSSTNYGLLLTRFVNAGYLPTDVTSFIWYQGESNGTDTTLIDYNSLFNELYNDWEEDFNPDHYYVVQVHKVGCGIDITSEIPEAHRQLGLTYPDITVVSSNGALQGSDQCHYYGTDGYETIAERIYNLMDYRYYNATGTAGILSPDVTNVRFGSASKNTIKFDLLPATDTYTLGGNINDDFLIENSSITVTNVSISGNEVTLTLSGTVGTSNPELTYLGEILSDTLYIFNQNNIGMLSFKGIAISDF